MHRLLRRGLGLLVASLQLMPPMVNFVPLRRNLRGIIWMRLRQLASLDDPLKETNNFTSLGDAVDGRTNRGRTDDSSNAHMLPFSARGPIPSLKAV